MSISFTLTRPDFENCQGTGLREKGHPTYITVRGFRIILKLEAYLRRKNCPKATVAFLFYWSVASSREAKKLEFGLE
ncbi:hypothetical protein D9758_010182 [Tetrapyrgos nigripes]|uniref:Uncharacterized protein n=1 Tax=Tetrapyrgos nigripes TaxID=182062 RepID=A0A8H5CZ75_9AGAR|nr:hypothetical protein D9758_010182 [Tetrapyrgos nigripes]